MSEDKMKLTVKDGSREIEVEMINTTSILCTSSAEYFQRLLTLIKTTTEEVIKLNHYD